MITYVQAIILGALQGITELFPISSLGHSVIIPSLLHWNIEQSNSSFLIFIIATHFATSLVLLLFFRKDWKKIVIGIFVSLKNRKIVTPYEKLGWLLVVATIPAGILGVLFQDTVQKLLASPVIAAVFLIFNGGMLYLAERLRKYRRETGGDAAIARLSWAQSAKVGLMQCLALLPGISRTGSTLTGGLLSGLDHEDSARFAFLLATPIIFGASALKLPELFTVHYSVFPVCIGFITSAIAAYFSVKFLAKYFETKTLKPFAVYCLLFGIFSLILLAHS